MTANSSKYYSLVPTIRQTPGREDIFNHFQMHKVKTSMEKKSEKTELV